ncbi:MAG: NADH dehydrogenase 1 alpha subcomplex assembly factor 3 [Monoraphidium minutum]|nr:MAG: NADH dehydrogenase 1 alpha subcomplex assembly factor 3 [Monoraphidium minutum]
MSTAAAAAAAASSASGACSTSGRGAGLAWHGGGAARWASSLSNVIAAEQGKTRLQGYLPGGFILNNTQVEGAILCLPELWLMWDVRGLDDVSMEALAVLDLMAPPPEVLVFGCGARMRPLPEPLAAQLAARGIAVEALDTRNALAYFNFLNDEGRVVVGALLPCNEE